jgi:hypothetical protein
MQKKTDDTTDHVSTENHRLESMLSNTLFGRKLSLINFMPQIFDTIPTKTYT